MVFRPQVGERVANVGLERLVAATRRHCPDPAAEIVNRRFNSSDSLAGQ